MFFNKKRINVYKGIITVAILTITATNLHYVNKHFSVRAESQYFSIIEKNITIMVGETDYIEIDLAEDSAYKATDLTWTSDNSGIVSVDSEGVITGIAEGSIVITATMPDGSNQTCTVTVSGYMDDTVNPNKNIDETESGSQDDYNETPPFTALTVTNQMTVYVGGNGEWIELSYEPENADEETITWKSSNPKVATVNGGLVMGIKSGTVKIIAMTPNNITATCTITIKKPQIILGKSEAKLKVGKRVQIKAECNPDTIPEFKSQNKTIASVTATGLVKAKKKGKTVVVVKANGVSKKFNVTVVR